jgi:hypothetical protein
VADCVAAAIEAGTLAVPDADDAVVAGIGQRHRQLAAHHRGGGELLVDGGLYHDRQVGHGGGGPSQLLGERADRRSLVARRERGGREAEPAVEPQLVDRKAGHGLEAREEDGPVLEAEPVVEFVRVRRPALVGARAVDRHIGSSRCDAPPCCTSSDAPGRAPGQRRCE